MSATLSKIHVTNSTGVSLNERFTAMSSQPKIGANIGFKRRSRSRSRSASRQVPVAVEVSKRGISRANQRLLAQLQRKHKMQTALKLKRRSMQPVGGGFNGNGANRRIRRGSVKAYRVGANGKAIRTNSLARVATMKADNEIYNNRSRPLRRFNSSFNLASRLGARRPTAGGAAQRVAKRNFDRQRGGNGAELNMRSRSRSRSGTRTLSGGRRSLSRPPNRRENQPNNRSRFRNLSANFATSANNVHRARSRSRSRGRAAVIANNSKLPIKARLGVRPGATPTDNRRRNASLTRRRVQSGRIQKRLISTNAKRAGNDNGYERGRIRSGSAIRRNGNVRPRSRSRTRKGQVGQQKQQRLGQNEQQRNFRASRGRSQQRRGGNNNNNNGQRGTVNNNGKAQNQRGRSRSRTRRGGNTGGSRNQGNKTTAATKPSAVNKDILDKELDQYMETTRTEDDMDFY